MMELITFHRMGHGRVRALGCNRRLSIVAYDIGFHVQEETVNGPVTLASFEWYGDAMKFVVAIGNGPRIDEINGQVVGRTKREQVQS